MQGGTEVTVVAYDSSKLALENRIGLSAAERQLLGVMPLHAITSVHGQAGLCERLLIEIGRFPAAERRRVDIAFLLMSLVHAGDRRQTFALQKPVLARVTGELGASAWQPESCRPQRIDQVPCCGFRKLAVAAGTRKQPYGSMYVQAVRPGDAHRPWIVGDGRRRTQLGRREHAGFPQITLAGT
jgi:hypothetical protein